jgi:hypothetical protein
MSNDLPGVNPATLNGILLYYRLKTKWSGLGDSTELSRVGLSHLRSPSCCDRASTRAPLHEPKPVLLSCRHAASPRCALRVIQPPGQARRHGVPLKLFTEHLVCALLRPGMEPHARPHA